MQRWCWQLAGQQQLTRRQHFSPLLEGCLLEPAPIGSQAAEHKAHVWCCCVPCDNAAAVGSYLPADLSVLYASLNDSAVLGATCRSA